MSSETESFAHTATTVVFVHHFGGNQKATLKHQRLMREFGFAVHAIDLPRSEIPTWRGRWPHFMYLDSKRTVREWSEELERALDAISGPKIVFTFSFPSVTVPALLARSPRADVRGWICDGGPFLDTFRSQFALLTWSGEKGWRKVALALATYTLMGGPRYWARVARWTKELDPDLPILSFRADADLLVPPEAIENFFATNPALHPQVHRFPKLGHLEGLRKRPEEYAARVHKFCLELNLGAGN